uniref:TRAF3-interacting protein 1 N-terminal domain-containing protein n=1 Tax=Glossina austeni TaxID=7395 RepID=A0A1A9VGD6_GLOAU
MADNVLDPSVIKHTQTTLGKYVRKPALSEKLLKKPPFRFLHDVFNAVIRDTGCFAGLYTPEDLNFETIVDQKTNQLLQLMGEIIEKQLDWKSAVEQMSGNGEVAKIVETKKSKDADKSKGNRKSKPKSQEKDIKTKDEKSNKIKTSTKGLSKQSSKEEKKKSTEEVKVKTKLVTKQSSKEKIKSKETPKAREKVLKSKTDSEEASGCKGPESEQLVEKAKLLGKVPSQEEVEKPSAKVNEIETSEAKAIEKSTDTKMISNEETLKSKDIIESRKKEEKTLVEEVVKEPLLSADTPIELKSSENRKRSANKIQQSIPSAKSLKETEEVAIDRSEPITNQKEKEKLGKIEPSRPRPVVNAEVKRETTFTRENSKDDSKPRTSLRPPSARPPSARPGAPRRRDKNIEIVLQPNDQIKLAGVNIKLETFGDLDDDGENLVVIENPDTQEIVQNLTDSYVEKGNENAEQVDEAAQQGHLVQQILETQKELVQETGAKGMDKNEKNLTKSINPLGKLMDFIPEDIDAMQLEYTMWRDSYTQAANELKKEKSLTESSTEPMKNQLIQIEANITEYQESIDASRVKILQNSEKILKLLTIRQ